VAKISKTEIIPESRHSSKTGTQFSCVMSEILLLLVHDNPGQAQINKQQKSIFFSIFSSKDLFEQEPKSFTKTLRNHLHKKYASNFFIFYTITL